MRVIQFLFVYILHNLKTMQANCQARCEQTKGRITDTGLTNRAMEGHSFKNFTVNKPFDGHGLCFLEKCRCQASGPNEGQAQRWVAWRRQDCFPRGLCKTAWSKLNPSDYYFGCFQPMVTWRYEEFKTVRVVLTRSPTYDSFITRSAVFNRWWLGDIWEKKSERRLTKVGHYVGFM